MGKKIGYVMAYRKGHNNYGTSLQGYALLKKMQQMGYEVEIINYIKQLSLLNKIQYVYTAIRCGEWRKLLIGSRSARCRKKNQEYNRSVIERTSAVDAYKRKKIIPFFHDYKGFSALQAGSKNYETIIVGSDQVWTPLSLPNKFFNLLFVDDSVRKVAYASSFGVSIIPRFQRKKTGIYLNRFAKIGVREQKGKEIVESLSKQQAFVVADPTLLLSKSEWEQEISETISESTALNIKESKGEPYIFCYFLGNNPVSRDAVRKLQEKTHLRIVTTRHVGEYFAEMDDFGDVAPSAIDPNDFIRYVKNASYVCTDSFHCSVFSIIFHKSFMTFYRFAQSSVTGRNSRIDSLFNVLGINKEHVYAGDISRIDSVVDWETVDRNLSLLRKESIEFLENALN